MPNLKVRLVNRTVSNLYVPGGIYVIDQWRQIGVETEHVQANETLYNNSMNEGTFDVALDFQGDSIDEPTYQLTRHLSVDLSSNRGSTPTASSTSCSSSRRPRPIRRSATGCCAQFETRMLTEAYTVPLLWWQRIIVMSSRIQGWGMTPSHLIGQDLETVWLKP